MSGESEEEEDDEELQNRCGVRENGLYGQEEEHEEVEEAREVRREFHPRALQQSKCEPTVLLTAFSGVGAPGAWLEEHTFMMMEQYQQLVPIVAS